MMAAALLPLLVAAAPLLAQDGQGGAGVWNSPRALELVDLAIEKRTSGRANEGLVSYRARAEGHVYFFLEHRDDGDRTLVKADQIALEIFWAAPDMTKQRIVGLRDESRLPNRMHYHLDHLMVVQDEFGDVVRLGDGDEVRDVPHPTSDAGRDTYDFQLSDSLTLRLSGSADPVRVYRLDVRPRDPTQSALVGALYLDRASGQIARMDFTFTRAAYMDRRLESISVSLENGLWDGRYWLPHQQRLEIRRRFPELDLPALTVIEGGFRVGGYELNESFPAELFAGPTLIAAAPLDALADFSFERGLYEPLDRRNVREVADLAELRREAIRQGTASALGALPRLRLSVPAASRAIRYNRAEGVYLGAGVAYTTRAGADVRVETGVALAPQRARLVIAAGTPETPESGLRGELAARVNELRDLGPWPGLPGMLNSLAAAGTGRDELDPYRASAVGGSVRLRLSRAWQASLTGSLESHRSERLATASSLFGSAGSVRPVLSVEEGEFGVLELALQRRGTPEARLEWQAELLAEAGRGGRGSYLRPWASLAAVARNGARSRELGLRIEGGAALGSAPVQRLFLIGGTAGLPGYGFRAFGGTRAARMTLEAAADIHAPWLRLRASAAAGWAAGDPAALPEDWALDGTGGIRPSLGIGIGLGYDLVRADLVRGLRDGRWQAIISVHPRIRPLL